MADLGLSIACDYKVIKLMYFLGLIKNQTTYFCNGAKIFLLVSNCTKFFTVAANKMSCPNLPQNNGN
jgi:hypothetical protein